MRTHAGSDHAPIVYRVLRAMLRPLVIRLLRPTVEGVEHVPATGPAILCPNHLSAVDTVLVPMVVPRPVVYLAKSEYFRGPWRWLFSSAGVVPVAREGGSAGRASLDRGTDVLRSGALLAMFPEGTRSPDGRLYRGRTGPIRLALRTGAPIIPIGLIGTDTVMPPHTHWPRVAPVTVRFGTPLVVGGDGADGADVDLRAETDTLMRAIRSLTRQTYVDVYARPRRTSRSSRAVDERGPEADGDQQPPSRPEGPP